MPAQRLFDTRKSCSYLSHVFGHEGPNSLASHLIKEGYATTLSCAAGRRLNEAITQFEMTITLTELGDENYMKVIDIVYVFIDSIKKEGPQAYVYAEKQQKAEIDFENVTKVDAVKYANALARRMNYMANDADADKLLKMPYLLEGIDEADIKARLALLTPENMFAVLFSQAVKKEYEAHPEKFTREYFYQKDFTVEEISEEHAIRLREADVAQVYPDHAKRNIKLGNAPPNKFMPSPDNLKSTKKERDASGKPGIPKLIENDKYALWFKQDDTFDQPIVKMICKIYTNDGGYPQTLRHLVLAKLWKKMLKQFVNEVSYMAQCAGIKANMSVTDEYLQFNYSAYNDKVTEYLKYYFGQFESFTMDETFFKNVVEKHIRTQKNRLKLEPYQRFLRYLKKVLFAEATPEDYIKEYEQVSFEQLVAFKAVFMKEMRFEWLICGHMDEQGAKEVCETVLKSVEHKPLAQEDKVKRK